MPKPRKRHIQIDLELNRRGGRRKGAGRKRVAPRPQVPHRKRGAVDRRHPRHITLRVVDAVKRLRRREAFKVVRRAMVKSLQRQDFRIVHLSIQGNHLHLVCEAESRPALSHGIQGFKICAARNLNKLQGRKGEVFSDRYHEEVLATPSQVRNAINYCLNNWRKHGEDRGATDIVDAFSTGMWFPGWKECQIEVTRSLDDVLPEVRPRTWLLAEGWKRAKPISVYGVPGPRR